RSAGLRFARRVVGVGAGRVVGGVKDFGHLGDLFLDQPFDALLQGDVRGAAALAAAAHLEIDPVVLHVYELDEAAVPGNRWVDHRVDQLLYAGLQLSAHAAPLNRYFTRVSSQGQLALRGLRSAEPRLGQPWRPPAIQPGRRTLTRRQAGLAVRQPAYALERERGILAPVGSRRDQRRHVRVERLHARVRMRPAVVELVGDQLAQVRP